eukprot:2176388-Rhodomonas_salina.4
MRIRARFNNEDQSKRIRVLHFSVWRISMGACAQSSPQLAAEAGQRCADAQAASVALRRAARREPRLAHATGTPQRELQSQHGITHPFHLGVPHSSPRDHSASRCETAAGAIRDRQQHRRAACPRFWWQRAMYGGVAVDYGGKSGWCSGLGGFGARWGDAPDSDVVRIQRCNHL